MKKFNVMMSLFGLGLFISIFAYSCKDKDEVSGDYANGVFITNEGNFGSSNGSVSFYDNAKDSVINDIFNMVNARPLGDVVQSLTIASGKAYMIVNASNKIEIAERETFKEAGTIGGFAEPRFMVSGSNTAYISQWGDGGKVTVVDLSAQTIIKSINVGKGPEKMLLHGDYLYVANSGGYESDSSVSVINTKTNEVVKLIITKNNPVDLVIDKDNKIWVLCIGSITYSPTYEIVSQTPSYLQKINPSNNEIEVSIKIGDETHPNCLEISKDKSVLYYGGGFGFVGIYKMDISASSVPSTKFIEKSAYGFSVNPSDGVIFVLEATTFTGNGKLHRYSESGSLIKTYTTGIIPNGAAFKK